MYTTKSNGVPPGGACLFEYGGANVIVSASGYGSRELRGNSL